ncbi:hypothetical protein NVS55_05495 [Myxococcus stipitatus]|uniref:hypothetical protein n=1 Tax=Myxococcus stipitatus TaxID=83455 RepID=UPI0031456F2C
MRWSVLAVLAAAFVVTGCATWRSDLEIPDREAIYDQPLETVWPEVREFFTRNELPFREDRGSMVLETEWRQEFGGSRIAGFFHRYMVVGRRETPTSCKLQVFRITKSTGKTLSVPGSDLGWGQTAGRTEGLSPEDQDGTLGAPQGEVSVAAGSGQTQRDMVMEWRVFRDVAPRMAKGEGAAQPVMVARAPNATSAPSQMAVECGLPILGLGKQAKPGAVMLLGELHGTREVPRFVAQSACQAVVAGIPVTVGLELPLENQTRVDAFLESQGSEDDWLKLMESPFWRSPYPDGRGSEAMANLLEQLRLLRAMGLDVEVFVFDHPKANGQEREDAMAATVIHQVESSPKRFHMILSGNIHSRTKKGLPWDSERKPMGYLVNERLDDVVALDMAYDSGTAWICSVDSKGVQDKLDCGVRDTKGRDNGERYFVHLWESTNGDGYQGVFYVGPVNASLPAVQRGLGRPGSNDNSLHPGREGEKVLASTR